MEFAKGHGRPQTRDPRPETEGVRRMPRSRITYRVSDWVLLIFRVAYFLGTWMTDPTTRLSGFGIWLIAMISPIVTP